MRELELARSEQRESRRRVRDDLHGHGVQIREPGQVVVGISLEHGPHAALVGAEDKGTRADYRVGLVQLLELLLNLPWEDRAVYRVGEVVEEGGKGLAQHEPDGIAVQHLNRLDGLETVPGRRTGAEALQGVLHVLGGHLAAIDRRLLVKADTFSQREDHGRGVWELPLLGEVRKDAMVARGRHLTSCREADEEAVDEARVHLGGEPGLMRIEAHCVGGGQPEHAAALGRLSEGRRDRRRDE